jgi:hypothetical protein
MDPPRRSLADHSFIMGLLRQRNDLREKLCKAWPSHQFGVLCKRIKIQKFMPHKKVNNCYRVYASICGHVY